jgi:hypothetical protein
MAYDNRHPLEMEARMYWSASCTFHRLAASTASDKEIEHALDEIEVIMNYTDWPSLKERCRVLLDGERFSEDRVHA